MKKSGKYSEILKDVLKKQIQGLIDQLYEEVGIDSVLITSDGDIVNIGTGKGKMFLLGRQDLREEFYSFCWKVSEENPVVTIEQDAYMPEAGGSQDNTKSLTLRNRKSSGYRENNFKEKLKDDLTFSEEMTITDWQSAVVDMPDGTKKCSICAYSTNYPSNLKRHLNIKHHIGERKAPVQDFRCSYCHYSTTVKCNMQRHLRKVHTIPATAETVEDHASVIVIDNKQANMSQDEYFDTSMNDTGASDFEDLKPDLSANKRRKWHHKDGANEFSIAETSGDDGSAEIDTELKRKRQKSSLKSDIECIYCHMCFADKDVLKQHIDEIHCGASDSGFTCEYCSKEFRHEFSYRGHLASHQNTLQCSCGSTFNSNWQLKKHKGRCKIAKAGLEVQKNSDDSNEGSEESKDAVNTAKIAERTIINAESSSFNSHENAVDATSFAIVTAISNESNTKQTDLIISKAADIEQNSEGNGEEIKIKGDSLSTKSEKLSDAGNNEDKSKYNISKQENFDVADNDATCKNIAIIEAVDEVLLKDQIMTETCKDLHISADKEVDRLEITVIKSENM